MIHNDNRSAEFMVKNPANKTLTKHIDIRHHFIRDTYNQGLIDIAHKPSNELIADGLTKSLSPTKHIEFVKLLNISVM